MTLGENASGTVHFTLVLDQEAASILRRDSFDATTLSEVFDKPELEKAGFDVEVNDTEQGTSIDIKGLFSNEKQLRAALSVFAPSSVVDGKFSHTSSLLKEKQDISITVDVPTLRKLYLENPDVKKAVEEAGIEFTEFETLINDAMKATTFTVKVDANGSTDSGKFSGTSDDAQTLAASHNSFRTRYLLNMAGALLALAAAGVVIWRMCRTPQVLLKPKEDSGRVRPRKNCAIVGTVSSFTRSDPNCRKCVNENANSI